MNNSPIFYVHFFSKSLNQFDFSNALQKLFSKFEGLKYSYFGSNYHYIFKYLSFNYEAKFEKTDRLIIDDLYKIDGSYNNVNFHLELDLFVPNFFMDKVLDIVGKIASSLKVDVYTEFFNKVIPFNKETVLETFKKAKEIFLLRYPSFSKNYYHLDSHILSASLEYLGQSTDILNHYSEKYKLERPHFYLNTKGELVILTNIDLAKPSIFPPYFDYLILPEKDSIADKKIVISYKDFVSQALKYLGNVAGLSLAYLINPKKKDKVLKIIYKKNIEKLILDLKEVSLSQITD
ncbi:MAG: hypothetical protein LBV55_02390 [Acholeplasmatales bacterium]|jgi:hypothetical protein|nr:hypothetical protein [Acholeplasmatales bacterium]